MRTTKCQPNITRARGITRAYTLYYTKFIPLLLPFVLLLYPVSGQLRLITNTTFPVEGCDILTNNKRCRNPWPNQLIIDNPSSTSDNPKKEQGSPHHASQWY